MPNTKVELHLDAEGHLKRYLRLDEPIYDKVVGRLESCKKELEEKKKERGSLGPSLKKNLNILIKNCEDVLGEINWYEKNGLDKKWKKEQLPLLKNKLSLYIKEANELQKDNFLKKHGATKDEVFNLKGCIKAIEDLRVKKNELMKLLIEGKKNEDDFDERNFISKRNKLEKLIYNCDIKVYETLKALESADKKYINFYKESNKNINDFNRELNGLKKFFVQTRKVIEMNNGKEIIEESQKQLSQEVFSFYSEFSGIISNAFNYVYDTIGSVYSYFFS